ncbi:MAG: hypothetical protein ICV74_06890 [Thermoleophilia bacterium]|nr:hypothetical protein [Thermoleophilia bacterium]
MNARLLERQVALGGVALLAALASLALGHLAPSPPSPPSPPAPPAAERWYEATVVVYGPGLFGRTSTCGVRLTRRAKGIAHPVLPCGARVVVAHGGRQAETRVIDTATYGRGEGFAVTPALAAELDVRGVQIVRWRFSQGG